MLRLRPDVTLTAIGPEHAEAMYHWVSQPEISRNLGLRSQPSFEKTLAWIAQANQDSQVVARALRLSGRYVGNVVVDRVDLQLQTGRLSVYIGEVTARGQGVGLTGIYLGLQEAFRQLALYKISLTVHAQNSPAINAYSKLGFQVEGILRDEFILGHNRVNLLYMGLLAEEFGRLETDWSPIAA